MDVIRELRQRLREREAGVRPSRPYIPRLQATGGKRVMPAEPVWLRADLAGRPIGVDRQNNVIRGYIIAQEGPFKSEGRGEFNSLGLQRIVDLMNARPAGMKSRFQHPSMSSDGLGRYLGRSRNARFDRVDGRLSVRGDLHLDRTSFNTPSGNLGGYIMDLAESDPEMFGSSLVLKVRKDARLNERGKPAVDEKGNELPPYWYPEQIHSSDVVDEGDAVHSGFLSTTTRGSIDIDSLPDAIQRQGWAMLDQLFAGQPKEVIEARVLAYLRRYLANRGGRDA